MSGQAWAVFAGGGRGAACSSSAAADGREGGPLGAWARGGAGAAVELAVPAARQQTDYSCGPAALRAVLSYFGVEASEEELGRLAGTSELGTAPEGLARAAEAKGLSAQVVDGLTLDDLADVLRGGYVVVVALQAWSGEPRAEYSNEWAAGHYVVVTYVGPGEVRAMDPSVDGEGRAFVPTQEFLERWHDVDTKARAGLGVVLRGRAPGRMMPAVPAVRMG